MNKTYIVTTNEDTKKADYNPMKPYTPKEEIRSGQSFLYREGGVQSMIVELRMKETISGSALKNALNKALLCFPYLTRKMIEKNGKFYLAANPLPFIVQETNELHSLGSSKINHHLVDLTYSGNSIYIAFHHGLCDGRGIFPFVETLIYYYCTFKYKHIFNAPDIRLVGGKLLPGETADPFEIENTPAQTGASPTGRIAGYVLPENTNTPDNKRYYHYEVKINQEGFVAHAKENGATPAILVCLLLAKAIEKTRPNTSQSNKPIVCNLVSDLRQGTGFENTYKNCVAGIALPYSAEMPLPEQAAKYRAIIKEHKAPDTQKIILHNMVTLFDQFEGAKSYEEKKKMLSFFNNIGADTFVVSYTGKMNVGECGQHIDTCAMYGADATGLSLQMTAVGEYITLVFQQNFETDRYVKAFADELHEAALDHSVSDLIETTVPKDSTFKKNALEAYISSLHLENSSIVAGYKAVESGIVSGYKAIENGVVSGYKKIESTFVDAFLSPNTGDAAPPNAASVKDAARNGD